MPLKMGRIGRLVRPKPKFLVSWDSNHLSKAALKRSLNFSIFMDTSGTLILAHCVKPSGTNLPSTTTYLYLMIPNGDDFVPHDLVFLFMFLWGRSRYLISQALLIMKIGSILARFSFGVGTSSFNTYFFLCSPKRSTN